MNAVNTPHSLEYAPSISSDGCELFFTRLNPYTLMSSILVAKRSNTAEPFGNPKRIGVLTGFVEAPSITADGNTLYYHFRDDGIFTIYKVSR
ncbi:MAG: hypothetical protein A2176_09875 [Spirochaetes bacterium RBG_13_51_14]|nr:MAG: hypothetical protein A2176_09875 [Spirochaetes bacterium RBG_13_51_14]